jgi:FlaA1/EpsC-like NDP-sugar epimerase
MNAFIDKNRLLKVALQLALVVASNYLAFSLRFEGDVPAPYWSIFVNTIGWLLIIRAASFAAFGLFTGFWQYADIVDFAHVIAAVALSSAASYVIFHILIGLSYSRSVVIMDSALLVLGLCGVRLFPRVARLWRNKEGKNGRERFKRLLIYGAGDAAEMIVRDMRTRPCGYDPVGFIDDDPTKIGQRIHGVPVLGNRSALAGVIHSTDPHEVLVAMPGAEPATVQAVVKSLQPFKIPITTLPSVRDIIGGRVAMSQIRELTIADLLPRAPIDLAPQTIERLISNRTVLVTGAGGSIGSELSRQIAALRPAALVLYERYENALYELTNELTDKCPAATVRPVIGDVTDQQRVNEVMATYRPNVVFHAAAHKHVPLMEYHPCEAVKNNVIGTLTVAQAADRWHVERFILISTDKAVNPSSVMGATKRTGELILRMMSTRSATRFAVVRFGNVLGSNGSVLLRFLAQIRAGGPVTVTHPEMRRYFMLIGEAVQLVLHAGAQGESGTYVLDMGDQIRLVDFARNLIRLAGLVPDQDIEICFVGLRPGEKLSEELIASDEIAEPTAASRIMRVRGGPRIDPLVFEEHLMALARYALSGDSQGVIQQLRKLIPTFEPTTVPETVTVPLPSRVAAAGAVHGMPATHTAHRVMKSLIRDPHGFDLHAVSSRGPVVVEEVEEVEEVEAKERTGSGG